MSGMIGATLRSFGFDPDAAIATFKKVGESFDHISVRLEGVEARLTQIEGSLAAIMTHMGLYVAPSLELMKRIEEESQAHLKKTNGPSLP